MIMSILTSVKKVLGLAEDYTVFDEDIIMHINSAFSTLTQLGVGPAEGFQILDATAEWDEFIPEDPDNMQYNSVRSYVFLKVAMLFDPPQTSYLITAKEKQIEELEWRLNVVREDEAWVDPDPGGVVVEDLYSGDVVLEVDRGKRRTRRYIGRKRS